MARALSHGHAIPDSRHLAAAAKTRVHGAGRGASGPQAARIACRVIVIATACPRRNITRTAAPQARCWRAPTAVLCGALCRRCGALPCTAPSAVWALCRGTCPASPQPRARGGGGRSRAPAALKGESHQHTAYTTSNARSVSLSLCLSVSRALSLYSLCLSLARALSLSLALARSLSRARSLSLARVRAFSR